MRESVRLIRQASASCQRPSKRPATTGKPNTHHFDRQRNAPPSSGHDAPIVGRDRHLRDSRACCRIGVYVHFPWCLSKCPYCDFVVHAAPRESIDHAGYADAVLAELGRARRGRLARRAHAASSSAEGRRRFGRRRSSAACSAAVARAFGGRPLGGRSHGGMQPQLARRGPRARAGRRGGEPPQHRRAGAR